MPVFSLKRPDQSPQQPALASSRPSAVVGSSDDQQLGLGDHCPLRSLHVGAYPGRDISKG